MDGWRDQWLDGQTEFYPLYMTIEAAALLPYDTSNIKGAGRGNFFIATDLMMTLGNWFLQDLITIVVTSELWCVLAFL